MNAEKLIGVYNILNIATKTPNLKKENKIEKSQNTIFICMLILFTLSIIVGVINKYIISINTLKVFALSLAFISQILGIILNIQFIFINLKTLSKPSENLLISLTKTSIINSSVINELLKIDYKDLLDAKASIIFEKNQITNHVKRLTGPVEIAGLIPSVIALYGAFINYPHAEKIFYFLVGIFIGVMYVNYTLQQIEKQIFLLDYAIDSIKNNHYYVR